MMKPTIAVSSVLVFLFFKKNVNIDVLFVHFDSRYYLKSLLCFFYFYEKCFVMNISQTILTVRIHTIDTYTVPHQLESCIHFLFTVNGATGVLYFFIGPA